jgi:TRAP-type C4-dicarboxylate transport system substrate-binding protein
MGPIDFFAGLDSRGGVFSIPFLFKGRDHANRVFYQNPEVVERTLDLFEDSGIIGCEFTSLNDGLYIAKDPIRTVEDFNGKKLRVNATDAERERFARLGASAVPMGLGDMVSSIQSGVIDGTMSGISIHVNFNLDDYSKTLLEVGDTLLITFGGISKPWFDQLPEDLQEQVLTACRDQDEFLVGAAFKDNVLLRKEWLERGGEIIHFSDEEFEKFHDTIATVGEDVTKGDPQVHEFYEFVKAASDSTN